MKPTGSGDKIPLVRMYKVFGQNLKAPTLLSDEETELVAGGFSSAQQTASPTLVPVIPVGKSPFSPAGWGDGTA